MVGGEAAAVGVGRQRAAKREAAVLDERAALAFRAEAEVLERQQYGDGERVVDHAQVDVGVLDAGHRHGARARFLRGHVGEIAHSHRGVAQRLAAAEDAHRRFREVARPVGTGDADGAAAVGDDAAVEEMQRRRDDARRQHVGARDRIAVLRMRVAAGMAPHGHGDLRQLLGRRPELVNVALRRERVRVEHGRPERHLELVGRIAGGEAAGADGEALRRRGAAVDDQRRLAQPGRDGRGGVQNVRDERRAADVRRVMEARLEVEVLGQGHDADRPHPGGEEAIDVVDLQARVVQRAARRFGADLELGLVRRPAGRMLVDAGDDGAIECAHRGSSARNCSTAALNAAGCSLVSIWPASSITARRAPAMRRWTSSALSGGAK